MPGASDNVYITNAGTYTVTLDLGATPAGLRVGGGGGTQTLANASQTLTLNGPGLLETNTIFNLSGGTLDGTGQLLVKGVFNWSAGAMDSTGGGGKTVFTNSATVNITTSNIKFFTRRTVDNYTTAIWDGGQIFAGYGCNWNNKGGSVFDIVGDLTWYYAYAPGIPVFNNNGILRKSAGSGTCSFQAYVGNNNFVSAQSGLFSMDNSGQSSGRFDAQGGTNNFGGGTHTLLAGAWFTGTGLHRVQGGTINVAGLVTITNRFELGNSGTIDGTNTLILAGPVVWWGGAMDSALGLGGRTVLTNTATVSITSGNTKILTRRTVDNYTTAIWDGGAIYAGYGCTWNNKGGSVFDIVGDLPWLFPYGPGNPVFVNDGTLRKSAGSGTCSFQAYVANNNYVSAQSGLFSMDNSGQSSGRFDAQGGTNNFGGGTHTLLAGAWFTGTGLHRVQGGTINVAGLVTITNRFELGKSGTIDGTNTLVLAGPVVWWGGAMDSALGLGGRTVLTNSATLSITTGETKFFTRRTVDNYTTAIWDGGAIYAGYGCMWNNKGGSVFDIVGDLTWLFAYATGNPVFVNDGMLRKSAGSGTCSFQAYVANNNFVSAQSGILSMDSHGQSSGRFDAQGGTNNFGGGTHTLLAGAWFTGTGLHRVQGGTINVAGLVTITNRFELGNSGTIDGTNTLVLAGPVVWWGGAMDSALGLGGRTVLTNSATVSITTGNTKIFTRRTVDNYTTAIWDGGAIYAGYGCTWNNKGGSVFNIAGDLTWLFAYGPGNPVFVNDGTLRKSAGSGTCSFQAYVANNNFVSAQSGILNLPFSYVQSAGLTELAGGNFSGTLLDIEGGLLRGVGNIAANVYNGGQVAPGNGIGLLTISNAVPETYASITNSLLTFQIGGINPVSGHDQLQVNSTATLAGTLRAELANGYIPTAGNTYTVMTFSARSGLITNFVFPDYEFGVIQTTTNIILIASNAIPALSFAAPTSQLTCISFPLIAQASDLDGQVTNVQFLLGSTLIANFTNPPYETVVTYDFPGASTLTARAYDNKGALRETNVPVVFYPLPLHVLNPVGIISNGAYKICMLGASGKDYSVLANTNLSTTNWSVIGTMEVTNGTWRFVDTNVSAFSRRFYRARQL